MTKRTLLIDADIVAFKFAAKAQRKYAFGVAVDDLADVTPKIDEYLAELLKQLEATDLIICLSSPSAEGWRKGILPSYKANRDESTRPALLGAVKDYMEVSYPSYRRPTLEADDIMGILSTHPTIVPGERVIVSSDKDMKTIPGWLYNPDKDTKARRIGEMEADYWHLYQTLVGDATDFYKGAPGCGDKCAAKTLNYPSWPDEGHVQYAWLKVVARFLAKGLTEADALLQARVARICRHTDYDFKQKQVRLWTPQGETVGTT